MSNELSQLRMGFSRFDELEVPRLVPEYDLRSFRPGDEDAWVDLLSTGDFGVWDSARLDRMLSNERAPLPVEGIIFATRRDQPVGVACAFMNHGVRGECTEIGWVVVHPLHRGHGLGVTVCQAVLGFSRQLCHRYAFLGTEDFRLAAIKSYLRLGFEPEMIDSSHPARWDAIRQTLAAGPRPRTTGPIRLGGTLVTSDATEAHARRQARTRSRPCENTAFIATAVDRALR